MANGSDSSQIGVWIDDELRARIEAAAARDGRSLSGFVRELIRRHVDVEERVYGSNDTRPEHRAAA